MIQQLFNTTGKCWFAKNVPQLAEVQRISGSG